MTRLLIKTSPDSEVYVLWTSVADGPIRIATRKEFEARPSLYKMLSDPFSSKNLTVDTPEAFAIADEFGSATEQGSRGWFDWDADEKLYFTWDEEAPFSGYISRENFPAFIEAYVNLNGDDSGVALKQFLENVN